MTLRERVARAACLAVNGHEDFWENFQSPILDAVIAEVARFIDENTSALHDVGSIVAALKREAGIP